MFEHLNLNSGSLSDQSEIHKFWFNTLRAGLDLRGTEVRNVMNAARDDSGTPRLGGLVWVNIGLQQFHLNYGDLFEETFTVPAMKQKIRGIIELVWSESTISNLEQRLTHANMNVIKDNNGRILFTGLWGNSFRVTPITVSTWFGPKEMIRPMIDSQGLPGNQSEGLGVSGVTFDVPFRSANMICDYYEQIFGCSVLRSQIDQNHVCHIQIGSGKQFLKFQEVSLGTKIAPYDGHHICLYINFEDFERSYHSLQNRSLVFNNPRFPQFYYDRFEDALFFNEYRLKDIIDLNTGEVLYELEHEIRTLKHPGFLPHERWLAPNKECLTKQ